MNPKLRKALVWIVLLSIASAAILWLISSVFNRAQEVTTSEFVHLLEQGQVTKVKITGERITGEKIPNGDRITATANKTMPLVVDALSAESADGPVSYDEDQISNKVSWLPLIFNLLFIGLIIYVVVYLIRSYKKGSSKNGLFGLGGLTQDKAQRMDGKSDKTFADVGGMDEVLVEVREIVDYLSNPGKYRRLGGRMPKGYLLTGPPGTGKTLLAKAVAGEAKVPFLWVTGSDFKEVYVGVGSSRVRNLYEKAKKLGVCIVFIDEIDSIGRKRERIFSGGQEEGHDTLNALLALMDGLDPSLNIVFMGATNKPDVLDKALTRPGRFDRHIFVPLPNIEGREHILNIHIKNYGLPLGDDINVTDLARQTPGMSGAELENVVNEAAIIAVRQSAEIVSMECFVSAIDRVVMGLERKSLAMTPDEKQRICVHEIGHAFIGHMNPHHDPVTKVSCIPRGSALGVTFSTPERDHHGFTREQLQASIATALGGRAAEQVILGTISTGASSDLEQVARLADAMVRKYAMSNVLGQIALGIQREGFLGDDIAQATYSEATAQLIDQEKKRLVDAAYEEVTQAIKANIDLIRKAAIELYLQETLIDQDLIRLFGPRPRPTRTLLFIGMSD
ncbi:MAG: ATP-dependent zinc metalloprotease FtsH [Patescibacteria group bacterium]